MKYPTISESLKSLIGKLSSDNVPCRVLNKAIQKSNQGKVTRLFNKDLIGDFFTFRESEGLITYCPAGRTQSINSDGAWGRAGRTAIKPAKWLKAILSPRISSKFGDHIYADFADKFKAVEIENTYTFELSTSFNDAYNPDNYDFSFSSCMWNKPVEDFYKLYDCEVLLCRDKSTGKFRGRAIIWRSVEGLPDGNTSFMDRIYGDSKEIYHAFYDYSKSNNIYKKVAQNNNSKLSVQLYDNICNCNLSITPKAGYLNNSSRLFYPYLDTFSYITRSGVLKNIDDHDTIWELDRTDGNLEDHEGQVECADGVWRDEDDCIFINNNWYSVDDDNIVLCSRSDEYILLSEAYCVDLTRTSSAYLHERYVTFMG